MAADLPKTYKKLSVSKLSTNFREAVTITSAPLPQPSENEILVKNRYVGVNATDINMTSGKYFIDKPPPFDIGFEGVGTAVAVGKNVTSVKVGDSLAYLNRNAYAEYSVIIETAVFPVPETKPEYVGITLSGLTAAIGLDKAGRITEGETVLITAAAGGTGHIAVQWAKAAGCHVIGTCSSEAKSKILKSLGCDLVINYKTEDIDSILSLRYPKGVDVVWETIGGKMFETCVRHLAEHGRLVIVGGITGYAKKDSIMPKIDLSFLPELLLIKSAAVQGFLLTSFLKCFTTYYSYLKDRTVKEELTILLDNGKESLGKEFVGLEGIIDGVEHLHSGASMGKVIVRIS